MTEVEPQSWMFHTIHMQRGAIQNDEIHHIYNRGVDKRTTFLSDEDYRYFIHLLYSLNENLEIRPQNHRREYIQMTKIEKDFSKLYDQGSTSIIKKKKTLVDILAFVLMSNHFHLLLKQNVDGGIAKFMQKLGTGYTMMFNEKYIRTGSLFQGRYKSVHIATDEQLRYIPHYIHINPLGKRNLVNLEESIDFLKNYRWSSFPDYMGIKNFPSVTSREFVLSLFDNSDKFVLSLNSVLKTNDILSYVDTKECIDYNDQELLHDGGSTSIMKNRNV